MIILLTWAIVLFTVVAIYLRRYYTSFSKYGVKADAPVPLLGNMSKVLFRIEHFVYDIVNLYKKYPEERFVGRFEFTNKLIMLRDLELIKQIAVKDFDSFLDHRSIFSEGDSFFTRNLVALKGQEWKDMRSTLSPAFTSSKIRVMVPFMVEVGDQMIVNLKKQLQEAEDGTIEVDCKDLTTRYANDVIASCAFGLKVDSNKDKENEFYMAGKASTNFTFRQILVFFLIVLVPKFVKLLNFDIMSKKIKLFFRNLVLDTMKDREVNKVFRPDMIHLLMEAKKGQLTHEADKQDDAAAGFATVQESDVGTKVVTREWTDDDLIAQAVLFFIAGFETISAAMCFLFHEIAVNPDVQRKLAEEIREHDAKNGGKFDFNSIQKMTYLDMVTSEVLRLWPPGVALDRQCNRDYNLGRPNKDSTEDFIVRKGTGMIIPVFAFHRDPEFFSDPDKFDPERFSEENKHKINQFAYMPFGVGPRNCIGSRFALCELKAITYQILLYMEVLPSKTTVTPGKLSKDSFNIKLEGGHNLIFKSRK